MKTKGFVRSLSVNSLISHMKTRKVLTVMLCVLMFTTVFAVQVSVNVSASPTEGECVIIIQGYEKPGEKFATNTVNATETAFKSLPKSLLPGGATVTALRPGNTKTTYSNKQDLENKLQKAICDDKCKNVVLIFIGHGWELPVQNKKGDITVKHGLQIAEKDGLLGEEVAKIIRKCNKNIGLFAGVCWAEAFLDEINGKKLKSLIKVAVGSCNKTQKARFYPLNNPKHQHGVFERYFLEDYYLIITDPNVRENIKEEAEKKKVPITAAIMHEAFKSAKTKIQEKCGNVVPVEPVKPPIDESKIKLPSKPIIKMTIYEDIEMKKGWYTFSFYKVIDLSTEKCVVVGWVKNKYGLPIAAINSVFCNIDCSRTVFKCKIDGKEHTVELEKTAPEKYEVRVDGEKKYPQFLPTMIIIKKGNENVGYMNIWAKPGLDFKEKDVIKVRLFKGEGKKGETYLAKVEGKSYDSKKATLTFEVQIRNKKTKITIEFKPFGGKQIQVGEEKAYPHHLVMRHSMYDSDGLRLGELTMVSYEGELEGEVWLERRDNSFPATGWYDEETGLFEASAKTVSGIYRFSHFIEEGIPITKWWLEGSVEAGYLQACYFEPPMVTAVDAEISDYNSVTLHWECELELMTPEEEYLFSGYRILRYDEYSDYPKIFDVPPGQQYFVDDQVSLPINYIYHVSSKLDNLMECECIELTKYTHYSYPAIKSLLAKLHVDPKENTGIPISQNFTTNVNIANVTDLRGYKLKLGYNNTVLEATEAFIPEDHFLTPNDPRKICIVDPGTIHQDDGYVTFAVATIAPEPGKNGSGTLVTIKFTVKDFGESNITLSDTILIDPEANLIDHNVEYGSFILALIGDLDGNGEINITDVALVCNAFASKPGEPNWNPKADMDGNGVINIVDVAKVAFHFVAFHFGEKLQITPPPAKDVLSATFAAGAESIRDESGCRSTVTISYDGRDLTGGNNPVTNVILKLNGVEWHDSGSISTVHYQNSVSRQVGCGETFNIEVTATNKNGQTVTVPGSITTPIP